LTGENGTTLLEVIVNNDINDLYWKELADYLRKLNVDFYWKMVHEKPFSRPLLPPRPCMGKKISMNMMQEHTPPLPIGDEESTFSQKSETGNRKLNLSERRTR
jgi:hypothetical protein